METEPVSIVRMRLRRFRSSKRGYYSFLLLLALYAISFVLPVLVNDKALLVRYRGRYYLPILRYHPASDFGLEGFAEPDYRRLQQKFVSERSGDLAILPPYPYNPTESLLDLPGFPPHRPSLEHIFGTDDRARDVFARLAYGFNVSITFALLVLAIAQAFGVWVGAVLGYFGGKTDLAGQRLIEIWSSLPFLYVIIIAGSLLAPVYVPGRSLILQPALWVLIVVLAAFEWMAITYYVRGEFYKEKAKDYVTAAAATGLSSRAIIWRHILPNSLTPVISFAPFAIVANIQALVALDFLGFGLPAPTPSWGELIGQGMNDLTDWWLVFFPLTALFVTLLLIVFVGEAVRDAFDPKSIIRVH